MDPLKAKDFLTRLSSAFDSAVRAGDTARADQFGSMIDQLEPHINAISASPALPQGAPPPPPDASGPPVAQEPVKSTGNPIAGASGASAPTDLTREAAQEAGGSWLDKLVPRKNPFQSAWTPNNVAPPAPVPSSASADVMSQAMKDLGPRPMLGGYPDQHKPKSSLEWAGSKVWNWLNTPIESLGGIGPVKGEEGGPGPYWKTLGEKPPQGQANGQQPIGPQDFETQGPALPKGMGPMGGELMEPMNLREALANKERNTMSPTELAQKEAAWDAGQKQEAYKGWNFGDFLGLLIGGRNFLRYKDRENQEREGRNFQREMAQTHAATSQAYHDALMQQKQQELDVQYAKQLEQAQQHEEGDIESGQRNLVRTVGGAMSPSEAAKQPIVLQEQARLEARRRALEEKKAKAKGE